MPQGDRYRSTYDPVSMFDRGAKSITTGSFSPAKSHDYTGNHRGWASNTIDMKTGNKILIE